MKLSGEFSQEPASPTVLYAEAAGSSDLARATVPRYPAEFLPIFACTVVGLAMTLLPVLVQWFRHGHWIWIVNGDEAYYLAVGSQSYFNHPAYLSDPVFVSNHPSLFRQLPLLPGVWMAWALGWGPLGIDICWRIVAAISIAVAWYILIRHHGPKPWGAAGLTTILLVDCGAFGGAILVRQSLAFARFLAGRPGVFSADFLHPNWRIASPALTMAYLLVHLWLVARARLRPTRLSLLFSGVGYGLLFHVYPYYWTAATAALALAFLVDRDHRRIYLWSGVIGGLVGSYRIYNDIMLKLSTSPEWLIRSDKLIRVSAVNLNVPVIGGLIVVLGAIWVWLRRRDLIYVWAMTASAYVLYNHAILSRIDIENYHWYYAWAPCGSLLVLLFLAELVDRLSARYARLAPVARYSVLILCLWDMMTGCTLRIAESTHAKGALAIVKACYDYQVQRIDSGATRLVPNATVGGDGLFLEFAGILENQRPLDNYWVFLSPYITDAEWDERGALNGYLLGQDRTAFEARERRHFLPQSVSPGRHSGWGPWNRDEADGQRRYAHRLLAYDSVVADLKAALDRYDVRYVGLPANQVPPAYLTRQKWTQLQQGPFWQVWQRP